MVNVRTKLTVLNAEFRHFNTKLFVLNSERTHFVNQRLDLNLKSVSARRLGFGSVTPRVPRSGLHLPVHEQEKDGSTADHFGVPHKVV